LHVNVQEALHYWSVNKIRTVKEEAKKTWVTSFKSVNLHPKHQISFDAWCEKIHQHLKTGEAVYTRPEKGMYDTMPSF